MVTTHRHLTQRRRRRRPSRLNKGGFQPGQFLKNTFKQGVRTRHLANMTRQLATLLEARLPLARSLEILSEQTEQPQLKTILAQTLADIKDGESFSNCLQKYQQVFSPLFVSLVKVGEQGGILEQTLGRSATYLEKMALLQRKIATAMAYPTVIVLVAVGAITFLLVAVVPTFAEMFHDFGGELPAPTKMLLNTGNFLRSHFLLLCGMFALLVFSGLRFKKSVFGGRLLDRLYLKMPFVGMLLKKNFLAKFCRTLGTLIQSGVPLVRSLEVTESISKNHIFFYGIQQMKNRIKQGQTLMNYEKPQEPFTNLTSQMVRVGEETGELARMLLNVAKFYEDELDAAIDTMTSIVEPVIIVFLGIVLGGTLIAMYLQMFNMVDIIQ